MNVDELLHREPLPELRVDVDGAWLRVVRARQLRARWRRACAGIVVVAVAALVVYLASGDASKTTVDTAGRPQQSAGLAVGTELEVPLVGSTLAVWLDDGTPVFVVNDPTLGVHIVDARDPHVVAGMSRLVWWCGSSRWFEDLEHGGKFEGDGTKADGPAPSGLATYAYSPADPTALSLITVTGINAPDPIGTDLDAGPEGAVCEPADRRYPVSESGHSFPRSDQPIYTPTGAVASEVGRVVQVVGTYRFPDDATNPILCRSGSDTDCAPVDLETPTTLRPDPISGLWLARVGSGVLDELVAADVGADSAYLPATAIEGTTGQVGATATVEGGQGGPAPCDPTPGGTLGATVQQPQHAPLQTERSFTDGQRWAICGASADGAEGELLSLRSTDDGATWIVTDTGIGMSPHHAGDQLDVTLDSFTRGTIHWVTYAGEADETYTTNDGTTWILESAGEPDWPPVS